MNNNLKIRSAVLISLILVISLLAGGCSKDDIPFIGNGDKSEKALKVYAEAVEKLKNEDDFNLKLTTSVELEKIDCSMSLFNSILKKVVDHRLGVIEDEVIEFSFVDGALANDKTIVPENIVQPVNSEINDYYFNGVTSAYMYGESGEYDICFTIGEEVASIDEIMDLFEKLKDEVGADFSNYDIHKEYPEIDALARYHSNFIDIMSVAPRIKNLMDLNNKHEHAEEDLSKDYGDFGKTTRIENGTCHLGETSVIASVDDKGRLKQVIFNSPISMDVNAMIIHNSFKAVVKFEISQTYEYSYAD